MRAVHMLALLVDFNECEVLDDDGNQAAAIRFGDRENPLALEQLMETGLQVILYDYGDRCEGVVRPGSRNPWVADIIRGSIRELAPGEFERLRAETMRSANQVE